MLQFRCPDKPIQTTPKVVQTLNENEWIASWKYDGWRLNIYYDDKGQVQCLSRQANEMNKISRAKFSPHFSEDLAQLLIPANSVLDAEFVGPRGNQEPTIFLFDVLAWNGEWLSDQPFEKRWDICKNLTNLPMNVKLANTVYGNFMDEFETLKNDWSQRGDLSLTEGIVIKHKQGKLDLNTRSSTKNNRMLKLKFRDIRNRCF